MKKPKDLRRLIASAFALLLSLCFIQCARQAANEQVYDSNLQGKETESSMLTIREGEPPLLEVEKRRFEKGVVSDFLKIEEIIYLDNTEPIGKVDKILFWEDRIYVLDKNITKTLSCFDQTGKFLHHVGSPGEGPGELRQIYDAQINPYANAIEIWDGPGQKLMTFDRDARLVREIPVDIFASAFAPLGGDDYLFFKGNLAADPNLKYKFVAIDISTLTVKGKYFPIREGEELFKFQSDKVLHKNYYNGRYYYTEPFNYNVYSFTREALSRELYVDCNDQAIPASLVSYQSPADKLVDLLYDPNYFGLIDMPIETQEHIYFNITNGSRKIHNLFNKRTGELKSYNQIEDDLTGLLVGAPATVDEEGAIYYVADPAVLKMKMDGQSKHLGITQEELVRKWEVESPLTYQISQRVDQYDNPFLIKCKFIL